MEDVAFGVFFGFFLSLLAVGSCCAAIVVRRRPLCERETHSLKPRRVTGVGRSDRTKEPSSHLFGLVWFVLKVKRG